MKKEFFAALLLGAVILVGCNPKDDPQGDVTAISVSPKSVVLNDNETSIRLACTLTPKGATATVNWSSSDTTIATVTSTGYVEAQAYGECYIYAQVGELKDSCHVEIKTYLESLIFNNAALWSVDTTAAKDPVTGEYKVDTLEASDGSVWRCYLAEALLYVFSDGFYVNSSGYLDGTEKGTVLEVTAPMYYGTKYLNPEQGGVQFSLGQWGVFASEEKRAHVGNPGAIDETEYVNQMKLFVEEYNAGGSGYGQYLKAAGETFSGAIFDIFTYDAEDETYYTSYIPAAICDYAYFSLGAASDASQYMRQLDFSEVTIKPLALDTVFGSYLVTGLNLAYDEATEQISFNDDQVYFDEPFTTTYGEVPVDESPRAMTPMHMPVISEDAALKARLEKQLKDKNIRVIRINK